MVLKLIVGICHDNNYKIRMDGVFFFQEYLQKEEVQNHQRFNQIYILELLELLSDEEAYIRIEALEIITQFLDKLTLQ
jgi:hypothetical protein